jgi:hypothetical protein
MPENPSPGGRYRLVSKATGRELIVNANLGDDEMKHVVPTHEGGGVQWQVEGADNSIRLHTRFEWTTRPGDQDAALDSNPDRQVYIHRPNTGAFQKWRLNPDGEGFFQLVNMATGFALDGSAEDIFTMRPNDGAFQRWGFLLS